MPSLYDDIASTEARRLISVLLYLEIPILALLPGISVIASNQPAHRDSGTENLEDIKAVTGGSAAGASIILLGDKSSHLRVPWPSQNYMANVDRVSVSGERSTVSASILRRDARPSQ
ncbi:hypothetical protein I7I51_00103 [Histoplasma capsulatum]|uniref:Uncharacterized protein n=1 Tax=Ajellomyces capsulatus TaxID=5037 RepID=A0A8A1M967_AJECA|nr:hypothetical protein I7I51_00103 [Histoplasma capsulatum]